MRILVFVFCFVFMSAPAFAGGCYSAKEAEAEQGIRIHSELMVIGLNCQHMTPRGWKNFYQQYREITSKHKSLFSGYEQTLISYFSKNGSGNAERKIHDMRTNFANETSTNVAQMRPDVFCSTYGVRLPEAARMSRDEFQQWAVSASQTQNLSQPVCH